ncbi:MAG: hypothetical protein GQ574_24230 [Crocinitomix sp.]|nr:hypothetical protein [Crocinitomix sp.]
MSTSLSINNRLSNFSDLGNNIVYEIIEIINENFTENNISKGKRGATPMITFVDSEMENVFLHIECVDLNPVATIEIDDGDYPIKIKVDFDHSFFDSIPQEISDYLQE